MRYFARSGRWRQVFFAACLPYMLVSVLVESFHTSPVWRVEPAAPTQVAVQTDAAPQMSAPAGPCMHAADTDESCPACNWLRLGRRVQSIASLVRTGDLVLAAPPQHFASWPASPVRHAALFRGPPASLLS